MRVQMRQSVLRERPEVNKIAQGPVLGAGGDRARWGRVRAQRLIRPPVLHHQGGVKVLLKSIVSKIREVSTSAIA